MTVGSRAADAGARVTVMTSVGLGRGVTAQQSEAALAKAMTYLHLDQRRAPRVVLFVTSTQSAQVQGIPPGTTLYVARMHGTTPSLYHVWLMAAPNETVLTQGMVMALDAEFDLQLGRDGVERTTLAICRESRATVRVEALRSGR